MAEKKEVLKSTGKPILRNKDRSISTESTITISVQQLNKGKHTNIPTIIDGKRVSENEAIKHAIKHQHKHAYPAYDSVKEAVTAAKNRSDQLGKDYQKQQKKD